MFLSTLATLLFWGSSVSGFGIAPPPLLSHSQSAPAARSSSSSSSSLAALPDPSSAAGLGDTFFSLATIDSDIANIPTNEFAKVFAGGIAVMIGGLISTMIVGAILQKGNLYADLAAESYLQAGDDPEFWKNLSEEETKKAQEMLTRIKEAKEGGGGSSGGGGGGVGAAPTTATTSTSTETRQQRIRTEQDIASTVLEAMEAETDAAASSEKKTERSKTVAAKAGNDMFSDYD